MAKPRVFISSTFYDLRQIRSELDGFLHSLGFEPVRNEEGDIPYEGEKELENYCYREIEKTDILISIIGSRFGTQSKNAKNSSISQVELETALKLEKQSYIFIEKSVLAEYETYLLNKDSGSDIVYKYVDDVRIYKFIEKVKNLERNNNIKDFETASDITCYLKRQFAGLFQNFLQQQTRAKELALITQLENTAATLGKLADFLKTENKGQEEGVNRILAINHPLVENLKKALRINYNFIIEGYDDLNSLLRDRGFIEAPFSHYRGTNNEKYFSWHKRKGDIEQRIEVAESLFNSERALEYLRKSEWDSHYLSFYNIEVPEDLDIDLPF